MLHQNTCKQWESIVLFDIWCIKCAQPCNFSHFFPTNFRACKIASVIWAPIIHSKMSGNLKSKQTSYLTLQILLFDSGISRTLSFKDQKPCVWIAVYLIHQRNLNGNNLWKSNWNLFTKSIKSPDKEIQFLSAQNRLLKRLSPIPLKIMSTTHHAKQCRFNNELSRNF